LNRRAIRTFVLLLVTAGILLSLSACEKPAAVPQPEETPEATPSAGVTAVSTADSLFTVRYEAGFSFNPITGTSPDNMALAPLMYEGLFVLNDKMEAEPVLCDTYETSDGVNYTFKLKAGVAAGDGSTMTASDVKYSLNLAMQSGRFTGRLKIIDGITAVDALTLKITLKSANRKLPALLDVPIIKSNTGDQNYPPGSGPYTYMKTGAPRLVIFPEHRDAGRLPVPVIYLKDCSDTELSVAFSSQDIDLFRDDPADTSDINILSDHEIRYYDTTILQFVGFNTRNSLLASAELRRAFGFLIDKHHIVSDVYSSHATASPLVLSPLYKYYSPSWENNAADPLTKVSEIFNALDLADDDSNGYLEAPNSNGGWTPFSLKFIVNGDNKYKVEAAQLITDSLKAAGIDVNLTPLTWDAYKAALESGSFDMYYGDVCLPSDYDLSELLAPGGALDYGHVGHSEYQSRIENFLAAAGEDAEKDAAKKLCAYIGDFAPIIPVLYRQLTVHTNKNVVSNMKPSQSNIFYGLTGWTITLR
jgi:peptide/nickel transport system substrate-binding protein